MDARFYLQAVNRRLYLPPWYRLKELNLLAKEFCTGKADGETSEETAERLGTPDEAAAEIRSRYREYEKNPLRFGPLVLAILGIKSVITQAILVIKIHIVQQSELMDYLPEEVARTIERGGPGALLTPAELLVMSLLGVVISLMLYFHLKYLPRYSS